MLKSARQGNDVAQYNLGVCYYKGNGTPRDLSEAFRWYSRSAEQGNRNAMFSLASMYRFGEGCARDRKKAFFLCRKAVRNGNTDALCELGRMYLYGLGTRKDPGKARVCFLRAAERADRIAEFYLAQIYYYGQGVDRNLETAFSYYRKSAEKGDADAMYELGRSLVTSGKPNQAIGCFNTLAASVKDSTFIARAYIELGMIYRNMSSYDKALAYYKKVIEGMPVSEYADAALLAVESIYKSMNSPEKYIAYIESIGRSSLKTDEEKEMMIYNAAEQVFISGNYPQALASLQSYLTKYPDGRMVSDAEYYTGECYRFSSQPEMACDHYLKVMKSGKGSFVEQAAMNYADLSYSMQKYRDAFDAYASLYTATESQSSRFKALTGLMRSAYRAHLHDDAIRYSEELGSWQNADEDLRREAEYVRAKSLLATSRRDEAVAILTGLSSHPDTPEGAEASWFLIQDCYDRGDFSDVEKRVYAFSESGTTQTYWLAKAFIVLGDAFVEMDNPEQAKATFESVASGYKPEGEDDDVLQSVEMRLEKLSILMSEENDL